MFSLLVFFWLSKAIKMTLFWIYLWQLKEYHLGRFLDHFRTEKGKKIFINWLNFLKIFFLFSFFIFPDFFVYLLLILYFGEFLKLIKDIFQKSLKKPVLTLKTSFLVLASVFLEFLFIFYLVEKVVKSAMVGFWLLFLDILLPFFISAVVLIFQPWASFLRNRIIKKAKKKREKFKNLIVIGITGSYGKTSTKEFLATILAERFNVLKTKEHQNSEVGISQCILEDLKPETEIFVCEMGAYNRGGIKLLCDIVQPQIGILTGINEQHMTTFGSQENIIKTKFELIESLPAEGKVIFNADNELILAKAKSQDGKIKVKPQIFCSTKEKMDFWAEEIKMEKESISLKIFSKDGQSASLRLNLIGIQNIENILLAVACAKELGLTFEEISLACQKIRPAQSGIQLKKDKRGLNIIFSNYSANPDGVISHLEYLESWEEIFQQTQSKKVIVMPCLIELGQASNEIHKRIGQKIGQVCDLAIITSQDKFREIKAGAEEKGMKPENIFFLEKPENIIKKIESFCQKEDILLLEGRLPKELINYFLN